MIEPAAGLPADHRHQAQDDAGDQQVERAPAHHAGGQHAEEEQHPVHAVVEEHARNEVDGRVAVPPDRGDHADDVAQSLAEGPQHGHPGRRRVRGEQEQRHGPGCQQTGGQQGHHPLGLVSDRI